MTGKIHCPCHCQITDSSPSPRGCHSNDMKRRRRIRRPRQTHSSHRLVRKSVVLSLFLLLALSTAASFRQQFSSKPSATSPCASTCTGPTANVLIRHRGGGSDLPESSSTTPLSPTTTKSSLKPPTKDRTVPSFGIIDENAHEEYHRRKEEWADRYTTLEGLRLAFGRNKNRVWGDLDATTSRRLYKSLLPNALCELVLELGMRPEDLAPLAYKARKAAKLYARERCHLPARIAAQLFDGYRQWKTYGRFQVSGMSYDQIWNKYRSMILHEVVTTKKKKTSGRTTIRTNDTNAKDSVDGEVEEEEHDPDEEWTEEDIVIQTCLKILERSCTTNERIDRMLLSSSTVPDTTETTKTTTTNDITAESPSQELARRQLMKVAKTLEDDVRKLLDPTGFEDTSSSVKKSNTNGEGYESSKLQLEQQPETLTTTTETRTMTTMTGRQYKALKRFALARRRNILQALEADVLIPPRIW
eukprot:CAMPEP_0113489452 /NCGR_PEP_ID=MMETSP0014_2-20120614/26536_1 /TAXON_ID=2857 /ORGANISM="Nitzschia sp." /LENGTH=471 /DNA_ID=CAMNT_0000383189 /DNA_START=110 /DNA_END=1522 /DNA_ORIENTATION=+ /assembly_acc=CAM_ASM_000159